MTLFLILLAAGVLLLLLEIPVPGGVLGVAGMLLLVAAVVVAYTRFDTQIANLVLVLTAGGLVAAGWWWVTRFPHSRLARPLVASAVIGHDDHGLEWLAGRSGEAETPLRPAGVARVDGRRVDVVTEGGFVAAGARIEVLRVEGNRVVVRAADETRAPG